MTSRISWHFLIALLFAASSGFAKAGSISVSNSPEGANAASPNSAVVLMLVRSTLAALNQANFTGNYTVLHSLGTPHLQALRSPADWAVAFSGLRARKLDLSPVLLLEPDLTEPATVAKDGMLRLAGVFRTQPGISFAVVFKPVLGVWRIEELSVSASPVEQKAVDAKTVILRGAVSEF